MENNFFLGIWYSPLFHQVTGNGFQVLSGISMFISFFILWQILDSIDYVDAIQEWKSCACRQSVKKHLYGVFSIVLLKTLIMLYICWMDFGTGWMAIPHTSHILHYCILIVFVCMLAWAYRSKKHFKSLGDCDGSISYYLKLKPETAQSLGDILSLKDGEK